MIFPGDVPGETGEVRLFVGMPLPEALIEHITMVQQIVAEKAGRAVRWTPPETQHLTLEFLGDVPRWVASDIPGAIGPALAGRRPVKLAAETLGAFPNWRQPNVIWLGITGEISGLVAIRNKVSAALSEFAFTLDRRPYRPHLTLGRLRSASDPAPIERLRSFAANWKPPRYEFVADRVVLYRSILSPEGPAHFEVESWSLPQP